MPLAGKEAARKRAREWRANNRERHREYSAKYQIEHPDSHRKAVRRLALRIRGITQKQYDETLAAQDNRCALCRTDDPRTFRQESWCIDHDHTTGAFRGLLCMPCNIKLGWYEKIKTRIEEFESYLQKVKQ